MRYGLKESVIEQIQRVLAAFPEVQQAVLYGSRAKGNYRNCSDIDLTLKGKELTSRIVNKISWQLDDLLLPYTFDLSIFNHISQIGLLDYIKRVGIIFYDQQQKII